MDPFDSMVGGEPMIRGGTCPFGPYDLRSAFRRHLTEDVAHDGTGFRVVREGPWVTSVMSWNWGQVKQQAG